MHKYSFIDIHSHLHDKAYDKDRDSLIEEMKGYGLGTITVGTDIKETKAAIALAEKHPHIFATAGIHPADNIHEKFDSKQFIKLAEHKKVVAIGECGLDYFRLEGNAEKEKKRQKELFIKHIEVAVKVGKPLMLHGRPSKGTMDAYEDMLDILETVKKKYGEKLKGNAHFFVGNIDIATRFIDIGFTMSFSGVITFTKDYDDVVRFIPLEMIHAETDSPYATPVPYRGKRNSPMYVQEVAAKIAVLRQQPFEEVRLQFITNAKNLFHI